ncbi:transmembrane protein, putative [Rhizoctonia solani AG-3 Rhs1AP]|uniref:Transmembrane protein, putative n=1 Tax=Rhizoctonia solani AG-3 Rhs1AP TaxID=1086054 RepID=X8J068_9AGAM|nr:transmembrane protein, putative [Rhizoctonia solani AG-3 Rhs1AP]
MLEQPTLDKHSHDINTITLSRLRLVLDLLRFPSEYESFALPRLVSGCIVLISSVKPSPFYYEYGYLSFRLMVIALTACLLHYGCYLNMGCEGTKNISPSNTLRNSWKDPATIISVEIQSTDAADTRLAGILDPPPRELWTAPLLNQSELHSLLKILYEDRKHFTMAMKQTKSLGLSGVIDEVDHEKPSTGYFELYILILCRCQLVASDFYLEPEVLRYMSPKPPPSHTTPGPQGNISLIDLEDSRCVIQAYTYFLLLHIHVALLLKLVFPLVISGCQDLLPGMFGAAMRVFWNSLSIPEPHAISRCLSIFIDRFWYAVRIYINFEIYIFI